MLKRRCAHTRGTVLLMFPAAVLIMFIMGAIVIDVALTQVRARELESVAASAANDALAALDIDTLRSGGGLTINEADARLHAAASVAAGSLPDAEIADVTISLDTQGRTVIAVTLQVNVDLVMAPGIGDLDQVMLRRTERAVVLGSEP